MENRFITGQAYVDLAYAKEGTPILIHQGRRVMDRPATAAKVVSQVREVVEKYEQALTSM